MTNSAPHFRLGKTPARPGAVTLKLSTYLDTTKLPPLKSKVGHPGLLTGDLGMLGNDQYGDCVWAGAAHETMLFNVEAAHADPVFTPESVLSDYSAVTGFNPKDPNTDQGTDMAKAAAYRKKTGVLDSAGKRHKVAAYLAIEPGNLEELRYAIYLFGAVGIGIQFPDTAMTQFNEGKPWDVVKGAKIDGGHYIPAVYADKTGFQVITWGKRIRATNRFLTTYVDEAIAYVSYEDLKDDGTTIDGFKKADLLNDLKAISAL